MDHTDHVALVRPAILGAGPRWADLGSGEGAFTLALADVLGEEAAIESIDIDAGALDLQQRAMHRAFPGARVAYRVADFTKPLGLSELDGILMANSLHFVRAKDKVLPGILACLRPGGRLVLVEYDTDTANRWVPYPVSYPSWEALAARLGLEGTRRTGTVSSRFLGSMYSAASLTPATGEPRER